MTKQDMLDKISREISRKIMNEQYRRAECMQVALADENFAKLDSRVREIQSNLLKGKPGTGLEKALTARESAFAAFYTPKDIDKDVLKHLKAKLIKDANISSDIPTNFQPKFKDLISYVKDFPNNEFPNLLFVGGTGAGKTYAAKTLAKILIEKDFWVVFTTAFALQSRFISYIRGESTLDDLFECDLLIIDDLGAEPKMKNLVDDHIYNILNERLANRRAFIVTTNLSDELDANKRCELLERYDQRIYSRLLAKQTSHVIDFGTKDLRF